APAATVRSVPAARPPVLPRDRVPVETLTPPVKELFALLRVRVPVPALTRPPLPEIRPEIAFVLVPLLMTRVVAPMVIGAEAPKTFRNSRPPLFASPTSSTSGELTPTPVPR